LTKGLKRKIVWVAAALAVVLVGVSVAATRILRSDARLLGLRPGMPLYMQVEVGEDLLEKGDMEGAENLAVIIEEQLTDPSSIAVVKAFRIKIAKEYFERGHIERAEELSQQVAATVDIYGYPELQFLSARILLKKNRTYEAIEVFKHALAPWPSVGYMKVEKTAGIAACYEHLGRYEDAYLKYLDCIEAFKFYNSVEVVEGLRRVREQLTESEKEKLDKTARRILLKYLTDPNNRSNVLYFKELKELAVEEPQDSWRITEKDRICNDYLYEEAERFGLVPILDEAEKRLQSANALEDKGRYREACLAYFSCIDIPWLYPGFYPDIDPVNSFFNLKKKLENSEKQEIDSSMAGRLHELMKEEKVKEELEAFAVADGESAGTWLGPEEIAYPFLLDEAERLGVDVPMTAAEVRLKIARHYDVEYDSWALGKGHEAYLKCIEIPWPYPHTVPVEKIPELRNRMGMYADMWMEEADQKTRARLAELLENPEVRKKVEAFAGLGPKTIDLKEPESTVYAFILEESSRLGLLQIDSESANLIE
jgi:tetratricopeptide (TPR) repeat protein